jgi:hypothetical protein
LTTANAKKFRRTIKNLIQNSTELINQISWTRS